MLMWHRIRLEDFYPADRSVQEPLLLSVPTTLLADQSASQWFPSEPEWALALLSALESV